MGWLPALRDYEQGRSGTFSLDGEVFGDVVGH